ncbi:hypothetical protein [Roseibium album]|uniref:Bbp19 family protein n=1 Tax=Roseibium album TaxID=311410 RepID=UPI00391A08AD
MFWRSLKRLSPDKRHRAETLERAYRSVFLSEEGQVVLADLAAESGMYQAPPVDVDERKSGYVDGRKALYARILSMINVTPEEHAALQGAARLETISELDEE